MSINKQNFYEILEINEDASLQEIECAYIAAKETYDPEKTALYNIFSQEEACELQKLIKRAYETLTNPDLRRDYNTKTLRSLNFKKKPLSVSANKISLQNNLLITTFNEDSIIENQIKTLNDCSGLFLQKIRKYKNISLEEISKFSKISKTSILAIEEEDFENLPAKVFTRGFVIQICKLLGINPTTFSKEYLKSLDGFRN